MPSSTTTPSTSIPRCALGSPGTRAGRFTSRPPHAPGPMRSRPSSPRSPAGACNAASSIRWSTSRPRSTGTSGNTTANPDPLSGSPIPTASSRRSIEGIKRWRQTTRIAIRITDCGDKPMEFGASIFFTDYSISPAYLAVALEERGFESLWAAEHSHIPVPRRTPAPGGGELAKRYYDVMDPFVTLTMAAAATKRLKIATGICLVIQRDTIQTAKLVASIDQVSGGRFLFGIGGGWNAEEMEDHGTVFKTRFKRMREQIEAMTEIWTGEKAEYHGEIVDFPPMMTWPKPVQKPRPPVLVGVAFPWAARRAIRYGDGWFPIAGGARYGDPLDFLPRFR